MKGAKCMKDDFMFHKSGDGQSNHPKGGNSQAKGGGFKGDKKRKWKKVPNKSQKPWDEKRSEVDQTKINCFNYGQLDHMINKLPQGN